MVINYIKVNLEIINYDFLSFSWVAQKLLETYSEEELRRIFKEYGELSEAGKLAKHLINVRFDRPIKTTQQLMDLIRPFMRRGQEHTFAAQVFQSIRIEVNDELESLKQMLLQTSEALRPGGRLVVMSYHSLEDRLVNGVTILKKQCTQQVFILLVN